MFFVLVFSVKRLVLNVGFWLSPEVLEGSGSSGELVGIMSTYPGTFKSTWSRVIAQSDVFSILVSYVFLFLSSLNASLLFFRKKMDSLSNPTHILKF